MQVVQVKLRSENTLLSTHIDYRFKKKTIKPKMIVELKNDDRLWTVEEVYGGPIDKKSINHGWNNNI